MSKSATVLREEQGEMPPELDATDEHLLDVIWDVVGHLSDGKSTSGTRTKDAPLLQGGAAQIVVGPTVDSHLYQPFGGDDRLEVWAAPLRNITEEMMPIVTSYLQGAYRKVNSELRTPGLALSDEVRDYVNKIDICMGRHSTTTPAVLYKVAASECYAEFTRDLERIVGHNFRDDGYGGCTAKQDEISVLTELVDDPMVIAIRIPPGTSCVYTGAVAKSGLSSVLLPRGATYRIIDYEHARGIPKLIVEIVALASTQAGKSVKQSDAERIAPYDDCVWFPGEIQVMTPWSIGDEY